MPALAHHDTCWRRCVTRLRPARGMQKMPVRLLEIIADTGNLCREVRYATGQRQLDDPSLA